MAKLGISTGTIPNDGMGDSLLDGAIKINSNFSEIYNYLGDGTTLTAIGGTWVTTTVGIHTLKNVGIGTTNPTSLLTVSGDVNISGILTSSSSLIVGENVNISGILTSPFAQLSALSGTNLNYTGVSTVGSLSIGSSQIISSGRELQNIASLDATTTATIESAIQSAPNNFSSLNVSGISTLGNTIVGGATTQLIVNGTARISGVLTALSFSGNATSASYADSATISAYSSNSGIATYANSAGIATTATTAQGLIDTPNIFVGISTSTELYVGLGGTIITATSNGLVGINSTSPTKQLDVIGDVRVGINTSHGVILTSPNGTQYRLIIDDAGSLSTIAV